MLTSSLESGGRIPTPPCSVSSVPAAESIWSRMVSPSSRCRGNLASNSLSGSNRSACTRICGPLRGRVAVSWALYSCLSLHACRCGRLRLCQCSGGGLYIHRSTGLAIGCTGYNQVVQLFQTPLATNQFCCQVIEQFRMRRSLSDPAKVAGRS